MNYYIGAFTQKSYQKLPKVTSDYLLSIGIKEESINTILERAYDVVCPVWYDSNQRSTRYYLVRKNKSCGVIYDTGDFCSIELKYSTIIPPIKSNLFAVENRAGSWGVMDPSNDDPVVRFGKYSYIWGFDDGLSLVKTRPKMEKTFEGRGIINEQGEEIIKPGAYNNIWDFYGRSYSNIIAEKQGITSLLDRDFLKGVVKSNNNFILKSDIPYNKVNYPQRFALYFLAQSFFDFVLEENKVRADRILCLYQLALLLNYQDFQRWCKGYSVDYYISIAATLKTESIWEEFFRIARQMKEYSGFSNKATSLYNRIRHYYLQNQK